MTSVLLAAVHNGELDQAPARVVITALEQAGLVGRVIEIEDQPPLVLRPDQAGIAALDTWSGRQWALEERWREYLGTQTMLRQVLAVAGRQQFRIRLRFDRAFRDSRWRSRQIESFVTDKHVAAWRALAASGDDALLVLESDATYLPESRAALEGIVERVVAADGQIYLNLAGGLDHDDIAIERLVAGNDSQLIRFSKPVSNTSCAYLVNRAFVTGLLAFLHVNPAVVTLGVDWVFNAYFLSATEAGQSIECWHANPPVLGHGSLTGMTTSWHPDRRS